MSLAPVTLSPADAWAPPDPARWDASCAVHLLQRIGFSAPPDRVAQALQAGLPATLEEAFGEIRPLPVSASLADYMARKPANVKKQEASEKAGDATLPPDLYFFFQGYRRETYRDSIQQWLEFAAVPANSAQENLFMFLASVLVVAINKIDNPDWAFPYFAHLRASLHQPYPEICRSLPRTTAMCAYLDLDTNARGVPNENYARELMELFTLGQGHYSEQDVKEVARAFTGFAIGNDQPFFLPDRWDSGNKTIFGHTGPWMADDVVTLIFTQPAARTHLPRRFLAWYLSDTPLPEPYLETLGALWEQSGWRLDALAQIVFSSRLFYEPAFRGNLIKNPVRFYLGLCQDLGVDVLPFPGHLQTLLNDTGQDPLDPPNVRGWLGGRLWLNPSTWLARDALVSEIFAPFVERYLADDYQSWLHKARARGRGMYYLTENHFQDLATLPAPAAASALLQRFLPGGSSPAYAAALTDYLENSAGPRLEVLKDAVNALVLSPQYQVC